MFKVKFGYAEDMDLTCQVTDPGDDGGWQVKFCADCKVVFANEVSKDVVILVVSPLPGLRLDAAMIHQPLARPLHTVQTTMQPPPCMPVHPANYDAARLTEWVNERLNFMKWFREVGF